MTDDGIDRELIRQFQLGNREAFDVIVLKYQTRITRVIAKMIQDPQAIKDIVQEIFIKIYNSLHSFKGESAFYTWAYRITLNTVKNYTKSIGRRPPDTDIDYIEAEKFLSQSKFKEFSSPEHLMLRDEIQAVVVNTMNNLPEELRTSIVLREMGGLTYDEIAELMQCPVGTVRSRISRARTVLEVNIKPYLK